MKSFRSRLSWTAGALAVAALAAYVELPRWLQDLPAVVRIDAALFREAPMPGGAARVRRPPQESRANLTQLIAAAPSDAGLYAVRAREAEEALDFAAAEQDWKKFAEIAPDKAAGRLALADYYHRRLQPRDEIRALEAAAAEGPASPFEKYRIAAGQRAWRIFARATALVDAQALPVETGMAQYRAWIARYPKERPVYDQFLRYLLEHKQYTPAAELIASFEKAFPEEETWPIAARARIEEARGSIEQALAVYDRAFRPLWPPDLVKDYFGLLDRTHNLRRFLDRAKAAQAASPDDLGTAARVFYYYQQQGNLPAAQRALVEYRLRKQARKTPWTPEQLWTLARLFEATQQYDEAVRHYYELYTAANGKGPEAERALAGIIEVLFTAPEQPIRLGAGDLSLYRDIAAIDPYPGFLNGILSLLLNSTYPKDQYTEEDRSAVAYFHRVRAAELLALFDARFPASPRRSALQSRLIHVYAVYGDSAGVVRAGRRFLAAFPNSSERTEIAVVMGEAYARLRDTQNEFAIYDAALKELAAKADGVPLGWGAEGVSAPAGESVVRTPAAAVRSSEYSRVLERYISRLIALKRPLDALALLRREMDRNPNDPGVYERLASFMQQNRMDAQIEEVYRRAIQQFSGMSWYDRLARWYVRRNRSAALEKLTREVVDVFSGSALEDYFSSHVNAASLGFRLYLQINLYAHQRFPSDLAFVHNLLRAYATRSTADPVAREKLLRAYWYHDEHLRELFFHELSRSGRLAAELEEARAMTTGNSAALRFVGEAEAWRSHFEEAAQPIEALAAERPGDRLVANRAAALDRSLAAYDAAFTGKAAAIQERLHQFEPRNREALTALGEIYADREVYAKARPYWNRLAAIEPGKPGGYLEAATVFWDYYQFDDALRLIAEGRENLANPALYAYEAGAIYEGKRDFAHALAEYARNADPGSSARARLLRLARRPAHRDAVEKLTADGAAGPNPSLAAVSLREAVLEAQNRRDDMMRFLADAASRTSSLELIEHIRETAGRLALDDVQVQVIERQIAAAADPIERIRLELSLMRSHEGRKQPERARQVVEALYARNPTILGVVRAAVDFYWRNRLPKQAIETLLRAASTANASLKPQLTLEAAVKAAESGEYAQARQLLDGLLKTEPFRPEYLSAMADTYARQDDDKGLREFYTAQIRALPDARQRTVLRRGLIPVLARQKDHAGAIGQYIEILRVYPEDEDVTREAAYYSAQYSMKDRLLAYFKKAVADAPRDFRWSLALARIETAFEDYPAAIAAYAQTVAVRPDRVDLRIAQASLEERLLRFEDALRGYTKIYELTYKDPEWMRRIAELHARRGDVAAAVKALETAFHAESSQNPADFLEIARILDSWDLLEPARRFAERGVDLAGGRLLERYGAEARIYARVLTRLRAHETALARLTSLPGQHYQFETAMSGMAEAVKTYFTPEEKAAFEPLLAKQDREKLVSFAASAGFYGLQARWLFDGMMLNPGPGWSADQQRFTDLQQRRMEHNDLARRLLAYWNVYPAVPEKDHLLNAAAAAFRAAGNEAGEVSALELAHKRSWLAGERLERYLDLLLKRSPETLVTLAGQGSTSERDAAANAAMRSGDGGLALRAVAARARGLDPVWGRAHAALTGIYYAKTAPSVEADFLAALGSGTIGERLGKPVDRTQQLAGAAWFPYGAAYGEYRLARKTGDPEDFLPALVEGAPAHAPSYSELAEIYRENKDLPRAAAEYAHALELDPGDGGLETRLAEILWEQGRRDDAIAHWRAAFEAFRKLKLQPEFWEDLKSALRGADDRKLLPQVRDGASRVLTAYLRSNGEYRAEELLRAAYDAAGDPAAGAAWIIELAAPAERSVAIYASLIEAPWFPAPQREALYQQILTAAEANAARFAMDTERRNELTTWRLRWIGHLLDTNQADRALAEFDALPENFRDDVAGLGVRIAARRGALSALLERYRRDPERAPREDTLREAAATLTRTGDRANARRLLEFVYTRELDRRNLTAANFLGLAEVRLEENDLAGALSLLRRMTLVANGPSADSESAADLLLKTGHKAEARSFLEESVKTTPWNLSARVKLGDAAVAASPVAPYKLRIQAAALKPGKPCGSGELDLIAAGAVSPAAAQKPFYYHARLRAAAQIADSALRLRLFAGALAINPDSRAARIGFVRAALDSKSYERALAALEPLWRDTGLTYALQRDGGETDVSYLAQSFLENADYSTAERAALASGVAQAFAKTNQLAAAQTMYRIALAIAPAPETRAALERVAAEERRREANARRRPVISQKLEQERLVRVRLEGSDAQ